MSFVEVVSPIEDIIEDARNGRMFILVDDEGRENEGDIVIPAQMATPAAINFMAKHGRGLICLALTRQRGEQLAQLVVGVPPIWVGCGEVAEDDLQRASDR